MLCGKMKMPSQLPAHPASPAGGPGTQVKKSPWPSSLPSIWPAELSLDGRIMRNTLFGASLLHSNRKRVCVSLRAGEGGIENVWALEQRSEQELEVVFPRVQSEGEHTALLWSPRDMRLGSASSAVRADCSLGLAREKSVQRKLSGTLRPCSPGRGLQARQGQFSWSAAVA